MGQWEEREIVGGAVGGEKQGSRSCRNDHLLLSIISTHTNSSSELGRDVLSLSRQETSGLQLTEDQN